jgi:ACS family hexuronate transporter-like MFS transporter
MFPRQQFKWVVCTLLFLAVTILYMDRQALSILAPQLMLDLKWKETDYGNMVTAYQLAYALGVFGAGWVIDRLGTRWGFTLFIALWSLVTAAHGWAASVMSFIVVRFALGFTQSGCFPCAIKAVAEWFPKEERALATGFFNTGSMIGPILAPLVILAFYAKSGWGITCLALGLLGWLWCLIWMVFYRSPDVRPSESSAGAESAMPLGEVLRNRATWAFFFGKLMSDPIWWFFLFWLPKFLHDKHHVELTKLGAPLVTVYAITILGSVGAGWLTKRLTARGYPVRSARKIVMFLCALLPVPVLIAAWTQHVWLAVILIGLATAGHSGWMANLFSLVSDYFPKRAVASVTGIGTMAGALGGIFIAQAAGWILQETGSYWPLFILSASAYLLAWMTVQALLPKKGVEEQ